MPNLGTDLAHGALLLSIVVLPLWAYYGGPRAQARGDRARFPFSVMRLLGLAVAWNSLILFDRMILGYPVLGPFSVVALLGVASIGLTAPADRPPGSWIVQAGPIGRWWAFVCRYVGGIALLMVLFFALSIRAE